MVISCVVVELECGFSEVVGGSGVSDGTGLVIITVKSCRCTN